MMSRPDTGHHRAGAYLVIVRLDWIRQRLETGGAVNCTDIAAHFDIAPRTARRDVDFLRRHYRLPIVYDASHKVYHLDHLGGSMKHARKYGPDDLARAGEALFGARWQTDLARALGLSDARRIRQWMARERPIPVGVWADICGLLRHRQMSIDSVLKGFEAPE